MLHLQRFAFVKKRQKTQTEATFFLKKSLSSSVSVSALAMTGTMLTTLLRRLMNSTSRGRRLRRKETKSQTRGQMIVKMKPDPATTATHLQLFMHP